MAQAERKVAKTGPLRIRGEELNRGIEPANCCLNPLETQRLCGV
jgi:hypothetical protein